MKTYYLTVFEKDGSKLLDETFQARDDNEAKQRGMEKLKEKGFEEHTHRCAAPEGHMVLFHR
ncbi:YhzD-like protein [Melghiribacillus thermohalophilus]|uniref:YhzD-like protein n=1 Tax=Melghiribacillus thermohalophilus TaxID=1324956 RepID=A0A4R3N9J4_9BACI|nr:YhzD family protein [Melghiribacillus thermohalophilus]TCT23649.1 YhzD-like protein [Melghiribacillus thermohalophilus]